jgi:hypothetical protein
MFALAELCYRSAETQARISYLAAEPHFRRDEWS